MAHRFHIEQVVKLIILVLLFADIIIFAFTGNLPIRPIRPFRILRIGKCEIIQLYLFFMTL